MEFIIPEWLTNKYIEAALQNENTENVIKVSDIKVDMPIAKGNNYLCDIFRVKVLYLNNNEETTTSLIVKAPKESEGFVKAIFECGVGDKEVRFYTEYLPKLNELLHLHDEKFITPKCYLSSRKTVLILQDLSFSGYKMVDRVKQLDFDHAEVTLRALAKFHAASYVLHQQQPHFVEDIGKDVLFRGAKPNSDLEKFVRNTIQICATELGNLPEFKRYSKRLHDLIDISWKTITDAMETKPHEFKVMNHGDCWLTNMLFKYNTQSQPDEVRLIDLQGPIYTSPAIDLMYFMYGSIRNDILENNREDLLKIYLEELNEKLKKFGSNRLLSEEELNNQLRDHAKYLIFVNFIALPWVVADPSTSNTVSLDDVLNGVENNPVSANYRSEPYRTIISRRLIEMENKGCI